MMKVDFYVAALCLISLVPVTALAQTTAPKSGVNGLANGSTNGMSASESLNLIQRHAQAQANFDQKTLEAITHTQYLEVSPAGEVDERAKMLGFYAPENKKQVPLVEVLEPIAREIGDSKLMIVKLRYKMQAGEQVRQFSIRASYMLCKEKSEWKVCSAQYTGIR